MIHYDALAINRNIALDLPFRESTGTITHSIAKTKPLVTLVPNAALWSTLDSHLPFLTFDGATEYLWASNADTLNLDFTSGDYSVAGWYRIDSGGDDDKTLMGRFLVSNNGWEMYHYAPTLTLQMRHHHAAGGSLRTSAYSHGWAFNTWYFMLFTRIGAVGQFYRGDINGFTALTTICNGGLEDPETCAQNLIIGANTGGVQNHHKGGLWRPRGWFDRALIETDGQQIWEKEVKWFRS